MHNPEEGQEVLLRAKVARSNHEQVLIEIRSMEGPYSIRVPLDQLMWTPTGDRDHD